MMLDNQPNPFTSATVINYQFAQAGGVAAGLAIYSTKGEPVRQWSCIGTGAVAWDGTNSRGQNVRNGMYLCRLQQGEQVVVKKIFVLK